MIDAEARAQIEAHVERMRAKGRSVFRAARADTGLDTEAGDATAHGTFVLPTLIELESLAELDREIFGPVLHLVRYRRRDLGRMLDEIDDTGYGLTLGVHSRIDETIARVVADAHVGNVYVNRNIVGAVVGVQPFGGEGLSGTGPKAGGPLYMTRLLSARPADVMARALASVAATTDASADVSGGGVESRTDSRTARCHPHARPLGHRRRRLHLARSVRSFRQCIAQRRGTGAARPDR